MNAESERWAIRCLTQADWKVFRTIRLRALQDSPDAFSSNFAREGAFSDQEWIDRLSNPDVAQFVAFDGNERPLGMVVGAPYTVDEKSAGLFGMWVAPEGRRQKLGRALVASVVKWATDFGYDRILLDVADNNRPAISLYESCNFERNGVTGSLPVPRQHITEHQLELVLS